ncbi:MAG TPA: NAD(P)-dependent oxidoreductase [Rhodospirillales bacterium]|nr:NAD(P)-dependent oxidoreductase [Rhodospirillales bacterium]
MKIGFVGLGRMGAAMAPRLLDAGHDLGVFDLNQQHTATLGQAGAKVAASLAELCQHQDVIITMLPTDQALEAVTLGEHGLVASMTGSTIHMTSGTHSVATIQSVDGAHKEAGQSFVASHVLGRPDLAAKGEIGLVPAGPSEAVNFLTPVFEALGRRVFDAGEDPASAAAVKIAHNFVLGCAIEAIGEGMALVRKYGVDSSLLYDVLTEGLFDSIAYKVYGEIIARESWDALGASAVIGLKDANLALQAGQAVGVPLPSANVWRDRLLAACKKGDAENDWAVMAREQFRASGLE